MDHFAITAILCSLVIFTAFFIRSLTGFGGALISIPILALFFDLKFVVPLEALFEVGISIILIRNIYTAIHKKVLIPLIFGTIMGSLLGTYLLDSFANVYLKRLLGLFIILFALNLLLQKITTTVKPISSGWGVLAGAAGGVLGGLFGTSGPPFVMYLTYRLKHKEAVRAALIGLFAIDYSWRVCVYATTGLLTADTFKFALILAPAFILGTFLGHKTHLKINETQFRRIIAIVLMISGFLLLVR